MVARTKIAGGAVLVVAATLAVVAAGPARSAITAVGAGDSPRTAAAAGPAGATTPYASYEAEAGALGGGATVASLSAAPTTPYSSATLEASGHAYVHLAGAGQSVAWTNNTGHPMAVVSPAVVVGIEPGDEFGPSPAGRQVRPRHCGELEQTSDR